jgi:hypothetical protein
LVDEFVEVLLDVSLFYTLCSSLEHALQSSQIAVFTSLPVTFNGGRSLSSDFQKCPRASATETLD